MQLRKCEDPESCYTDKSGIYDDSKMLTRRFGVCGREQVPHLQPNVRCRQDEHPVRAKHVCPSGYGCTWKHRQKAKCVF